MELLKVKANLVMDFNGNTTSLTPIVRLNISGSRGCAMVGKAATPMLHPVLLSSGCTSIGGSWKDFWQVKKINLIVGGCVEHDPVILLERKFWEIICCTHLQAEKPAYTGPFHPVSENAS